MPKAWSGRAVANARAVVATWLPAKCGKCGDEVTPSDNWIVGHKKSRHAYPELTWVVSNWQAEHRKCSDRSGHEARAEKKARFSPQNASQEAPAPSFPHTHGHEKPLIIREDLTWANLCKNAPLWLKPFLKVPKDAAPPLAVSGVHPEATGSYGRAAIKWMETALTERGKPLRLRWWQKLAIVLQLQHRKDGSLCYRVILESGPRRIGKSVRLRAMALWRLKHGPDLFEPEQLVLHTGKDLAIVREVLRKAWPWADMQTDWNSKKGMTEPEVSYLGNNRWVPRSKDATNGYDACLGLVDESWDVPAPAIDDDLEPTMLERQSPQLLLTSTAHRKATSLMRGRLSDALAADDGETMILLWGALATDDPSKPETWRKASPHWSEDRRKMIASKYKKALAGQVDAEADDPDPFEGFLAQYLNVWRLNVKASEKGEAITTAEKWDALEDEFPDGVPDAIAIESWFSEGVCVAAAWNNGFVKVIDVPDMATAAEVIEEAEYTGTLHVGTSLADDPALQRWKVKAMSGRLLSATQEMTRLMNEGVISHDGSEPLRSQVLAIRTTPGADGPRMASRSRADAVKAATWAVTAARGRKRLGKPRILLPSA